MPRTIYLTSFPRGVYRPDADHWVLTPNIQAASTQGVTPLSLDMLASQILKAADREVATAIVAETLLREAVYETLNPHDLDGASRQLSTLVREMIRVGVSTDALRSADSNAAQQLAAVLERYEALLTERGLIDGAARLWAAAPMVQRQEKLFVYGYPRVGRADLYFLDAVAADGSVFVLPYTEDALFSENLSASVLLQQRGWEVVTRTATPATVGDRLSQRFLTPQVDTVEVRAEAYRDRESEVRGALGRVKHLLRSGVSLDEVVLVARREAEYGPTIAAVAWEYGVPVQLGYAVPLSETRCGAWLTQLIEVVEGGTPFEATVRFLKHPLGNNVPAAVWSQARKYHPQDLAGWTSLGADMSALDWPAKGTRDNFNARLEALLAKLGIDHKTAANLQDVAALAFLRRELGAMPSDDQLLLEAYFADIRAALERFTVPYHLEVGGVALHTPLAVFGACYTHVFALGVAEGVFPEALSEPPLLDFRERKLLAAHNVPVETAAERARRERLSVWAMLQTVGETLTLSYSRQVGNQDQIESPIFAALGLTPRSAQPEFHASLEEARQCWLLDSQVHDDSVLENARRGHAVELRREGHEPHDAYDGQLGLPLALADFSFSATSLTRLGQCPFHWFLSKALELKELEEAETDLSPSLRGKLYHRVLELAVNASKAGDGTRAEVMEALIPSFKRAERKLELTSLVGWEKRRAEHLAYLSRAVQDPEFMPEGTEVVDTEVPFEATWRDLKITGVIDRIDRTPDGIVIKDYKTSSSKPKGAKDETGSTKIDVQLPIYLYAAQTDEQFQQETVIGGHYYSLTKREKRILGRAKPGDAALAPLAEQVKEALASGAFPVDPDSLRNACQYCEFDLVCRQGPRVERKRSSNADV